MKSPAFKLISLFVQLLHFKITFSPLWMRKGKQESKFSINFLNTAFFLNRHVGIQRKYKTTGMYSVDWQTETEPTLSFLFLPLVCFPFIFILKAHNTSFFFFWMGKGQLKVISRTFKLWLLPTPHLQLFSCPLGALASRPLNLVQFLNTFILALACRSPSMQFPLPQTCLPTFYLADSYPSFKSSLTCPCQCEAFLAVEDQVQCPVCVRLWHLVGNWL